jgi:hypothetical protein
MKKKKHYHLLATFLLVFVTSFGYAQENTADQSILSKEPNFLKTRLKSTDSLFLIDINVIKTYVTLDSIDIEILKPQILYTVLIEAKVDSAVTYQTLINAIQTFKEGIGYAEFRKGIILYKQMALIKVNPQNWTNDQALFRKLGFTEADLDDFLLFISKAENKDMNYKQAYLAYMKEIDNLK